MIQTEQYIITKILQKDGTYLKHKAFKLNHFLHVISDWSKTATIIKHFWKTCKEIGTVNIAKTTV